MSRATVDPQKKYAHLLNEVNWAVCDLCGWNWPESILNLRDGRKVCPNHSTYKESSRQITTRLEKAAARLARQKEPIPKWPHPPEMRDVSGIELLTPSVVGLTRGGANKSINVKGRNLSGLDVVAFSSASVAFVSFAPAAIDPDTRGNTATLTVNAPIGGVNGDYDLLFNGDVFKGVFQVRG
jgi:hypothetical protein